MNWSRLLKNKCPKCATRAELSYTITPGYLRCTKCDFAINKDKFKNVCTNMAERKLISNAPITHDGFQTNP